MMHIARHVKSTKSLPTHNVIYSLVQWCLKERHVLSEVSSEVLSWTNGG